jgi:hypothetical protein
MQAHEEKKERKEKKEKPLYGKKWKKLWKKFPPKLSLSLALDSIHRRSLPPFFLYL